MMEEGDAPVAEGSRRSGRGKRIVLGTVVVVALGGAGWAYAQVRAARTELGQAQSTLKLQVLSSRLGAAALYAEYGDYDQARTLASGVFEGIQNLGIAHGYLPENYARVLQVRDEVIAALATGQPEVKSRMTELFFQLQLPVDTRLDPDLIIPATDSGAGMDPPTRPAPAVDTLLPGLVPPPKGANPTRPASVDTVRPDTLR